MAKYISINNPILGGVVIAVLVGLVWVFIFSFGWSKNPILSITVAVIITLVFLYKYYTSFWRKKGNVSE